MDEGVPRGVGVMLQEARHEVIFLHEAIATGSNDDLVASAAIANDAILVAIDKDMRTSAKRNKISLNQYKRLSLLQLRCRETQAANRVRQALTLIEAEWNWAENKSSRRLFIEIGDSRIITNR
nr:DUF5615 family PIN-like protein [Paracoccus sp. pheM1]